MNTSRMLTVARTDLRQLRQSPDFWGPMALMAALFFVILPSALLLGVTAVEESKTVQELGEQLPTVPTVDEDALSGGDNGPAYGLAVYLFAPLAVVVPMTISSAIGANTIVGERERGTGEFLAHTPLSEREIYLGKLVASLVPGYLTTIIGFGIYSVLVNVIVGPSVGGWFFPTTDWWILMLWVVPPFLALAISVVLRVSARVKSAAAAQQSSGLVTLPLIILSYGQSSWGSPRAGYIIGAIAWVAAVIGLWRGSRAVTRPRLLGVDLDRPRP